MLATLLLAALSAPADDAKKDKAPPAKKELFAAEKWYKDQKGKEEAFEGTLKYTPLPDGVGIIGRHNDFQLEMTVKGKKDVREVYVGGKPELLKAYSGKKVKLTGKAVEVEVVGKTHREIWPARVELVAEKKKGK
jgi:hypothetical protein